MQTRSEYDLRTVTDWSPIRAEPVEARRRDALHFQLQASRRFGQHGRRQRVTLVAVRLNDLTLARVYQQKLAHRHERYNVCTRTDGSVSVVAGGFGCPSVGEL